MHRDGRDAVISLYYHSLFRNEVANGFLVEYTRRKLRFQDYRDIESNLPQFIEYLFERNRYPRFSWSDFVRSWVDRGAIEAHYEQLLADTPVELSRVIEGLTGVPVDRRRILQVCRDFSFQRQTGRRPGEEDPHRFLRKGVAGDWKKHFNREARQVFHHYAAKELVMLGYEEDDSWVSS